MFLGACGAAQQKLVMPGLDPGIYVLLQASEKGVDGRVKPGPVDGK